MQIDRSALERLLALDDKALTDTVNSLASAAGLDPASLGGVTGNLDRLRRGLRGMSDKDISRAADMIGKERTEQIFKAVKGEQNGE